MPFMIIRSRSPRRPRIRIRTVRVPGLLGLRRLDDARISDRVDCRPFPAAPRFTAGLVSSRHRRFNNSSRTCLCNLVGGEFLGCQGLRRHYRDPHTVAGDLFQIYPTAMTTANQSQLQRRGVAQHRFRRRGVAVVGAVQDEARGEPERRRQALAGVDDDPLGRPPGLGPQR